MLDPSTTTCDAGMTRTSQPLRCKFVADSSRYVVNDASAMRARARATISYTPANARSTTFSCSNAWIDAEPVAVVRVEQVYPWPAEQVAALFERYENADSVFW